MKTITFDITKCNDTQFYDFLEIVESETNSFEYDEPETSERTDTLTLNEIDDDDVATIKRIARRFNVHIIKIVNK